MTVTPNFTILSTDNREFVGRYRGQGKDNTYDNREFVAWDGEGWTEHTDPLCAGNRGRSCLRYNCVHHYCLFGSSKGMSKAGDSLSTRECLDLILHTGRKYPRAIHIGFAFQYDVNMILRDLSPKHMQLLKENTFVTWRGYRIEHIPKKWITVSKGGISVRIQDVFSFFACSFVKALKGWNVGTPEEITDIESGKGSRDSFRLDQVDEFIRPYWLKELELLVLLGNRLREILYSADIKISQWFGPGNIASFLYQKHSMKKLMNQELPRDVRNAAQYAYAGGRFEGFRAGLHNGPIYSADINSAYPYVLSRMPNLQTGLWHRSTDDADLSTVRTRIGLYRIHFEFSRAMTRKARNEGFPLPVFNRRKSGQVWYPERSECWYHASEFQLLLDIHAESGGKAFSVFDVKEAWIYEDDGTSPFQWVSEMYDQRREWKDAGNPAERALKLGLNSLYGKLAQRIGSKDGKPPQWHQLEYAGAITAGCRSMLYRATLDHWETIVGVETDGIYSTAPFGELQNGTGLALGQWETQTYEGMLFLQNGVYWLRGEDGDWLPPKSRGIPQTHLGIDAALSSLDRGISLKASQQYFIGYGTALHRDPVSMRGWRQWRTGNKEFVFGGNGKRFHNPDTCAACATGIPLDGGLHTLSLRLPEPGPLAFKSAKHYLPWADNETYDGVDDVQFGKRWDIIDA